MNWDTIKLFLAVHRLGSARAVALEEGISASTVTRRLTDLEAKLNVKLFSRHNSGFELTGFGFELLAVAQRMESDAYDIERKLLAKSNEMAGIVRITIPVHLMTDPFMSAVARLSESFPGLELDVIPSWEVFSLAKGEADIALRLMYCDDLPPEELVGVKVADIYCANYVAKHYLALNNITLDDLLDPEKSKECHVIGWGDGAAFPDWVKDSALPHLRVKHCFNDPLMQLYAAKAGMGVAVLPCFLCDAEPELLRLPSACSGRVADSSVLDSGYPEKWHRFDLWMLSHPDLRDTSRFKVVRQFLREYFFKAKAIWQGDAL